MNYIETLDYIHSLGRFSLPATLERIKKVLNVLGNPQNEFKSIHIAGTNGKGSVSAMLHSVFKNAGYKTGLFISPFIIEFRERIQINGKFISEEDLVDFSQRIIDTKIELNEFEFITAVAFLYFKEQKCDIVICETGLGGRLDATNALENKIATVITKIGLDHTAVLGESLEAIAEEKCGILRDCPTITSPYQPEKAYNVIKSKAKNLIVPQINALQKSGENSSNCTYLYNNEKYLISLKGDYQIENSLIAIETIKNCGINISYDILYKALANTYFPARMEIVSKEPLIIIDGAHNPDGAKELATELKKFNGNAVAIVGMMQDKDYEEVIKTTTTHCSYAIAVEVANLPRSLSKEKLCETVSKYCKCEAANDYMNALARAKEKAVDCPIFVFGSLYLAADIRKILLDN